MIRPSPGRAAGPASRKAASPHAAILREPQPLSAIPGSAASETAGRTAAAPMPRAAMGARMRRPAFGAFLAALLAAVPAAAQEVDSPHDPEAGADSYALFCATCHGPEARGDGPTAEILAIAPPDLTALSAGNGGTFPLARVVSRIDGRDPLLAHGSPMPLYGPFFEGGAAALATPSGQPLLTSEPIADLVAWLRSIQEGT